MHSIKPVEVHASVTQPVVKQSTTIAKPTELAFTNAADTVKRGSAEQSDESQEQAQTSANNAASQAVAVGKKLNEQEAAAKKTAEEKAKQEAEAAAQKKADAEAAVAKAKTVQATQSAQAKTTSTSVSSSSSTPVATTNTTSTTSAASSTSTSGLNMNQTSGSVNIQALANWLATNKGTFSASQWANIIRRESNGQVDACNSSSGAYGVLQLLGHGEYRGMTLGQQLAMAQSLPASAWAETSY